MRPQNSFNRSILPSLIIFFIGVTPIITNILWGINISWTTTTTTPLIDIDLTTSTDFEDAFMLAVESLETCMHDMGLFLDGGFSVGTSHWSTMSVLNLVHVR